MSVQTLRARWIYLSENFRSFVNGFIAHREKDDQEHEMTPEEKLDETLEQSFPASDPPGHMSKSYEDKASHRSSDSSST